MKKTLIVVLMAALMIPMLTGCKKKAAEEDEWSYVDVLESSEESSEEAPEESSEEASVPEECSEESVEEVKEDFPYCNPLTGEGTYTDYTNTRAYVAMCNDISVSMPQCGVSQADMIMEMMDESTVTRFMVFFTDPSEVEKIGSIRSARQYNCETALGYDAFLGHCGGSAEAMDYISYMGMADIDAYYITDGTYYRDWSRGEYGTEHTLFAIGEYMVNYAENNYRLEHEDDYDSTYGMVFSENAVDQCTESATEINVIYDGGKTSDFTYDAETNAYTFYQFGDEYTDDGEGGIPFANVINIYADTWLQSDGVHLSIDLSGGTGTFFTGGKAVAINWYKDGEYDCFHYTLEDGTPLQFSVGKTFVCVNQCGSYEGTCTWN